MKTKSCKCPAVRSQGTRFPTKSYGFTLVEVLLSMVILAMIMLIVTQVIGAAQKSWKGASSRVTQFREARTAFDRVVRSLRQATLPSQYMFQFPNGKVYPDQPYDMPQAIIRQTQLGIQLTDASKLMPSGGGQEAMPGHGIIFQAPLGKSSTQASSGASNAPLEFDQLKSLLNVCGYFVQFGSDNSYLPLGLANRLQPKYRYRLFEYHPDTEHDTATIASEPEGSWMTVKPGSTDLVPVAENIITLAFAFAFTSHDSYEGGVAIDLAKPATSSGSAQSYFSAYNSYTGYAAGGSGVVNKGRLPRSVQVIMVALDEDSANRLSQRYGTAPPAAISGSGATFADPTKYESNDLERLRRSLVDAHLNYRIFSSIVLVPGSDA